ncbi:unnamed protein product [Hydatigera taeniaeformis]|uniref:Secreted protein n=1 Tax=Hydatigena taeniaeformis TaxID=6205 RepID=A0A0R3WUQ7_HYDTA|nr:unnamed protein product [Hydatigera taeniaeformis]
MRRFPFLCHSTPSQCFLARIYLYPSSLLLLLPYYHHNHQCHLHNRHNHRRSSKMRKRSLGLVQTADCAAVVIAVVVVPIAVPLTRDTNWQSDFWTPSSFRRQLFSRFRSGTSSSSQRTTKTVSNLRPHTSTQCNTFLFIIHVTYYS